ncbi:holin-associated N-acetylmuramidase [Marivivens donghaensis]|uniref:holin-associated N-acetylmuramidase n=1 Tax=Marivivens donghaensis TaxID=1699413 RepID=UPI00201EF7CE|nr:holin-associated N-acetylmuramidase [Marivivens donghaensis]MCL7408010.1 holin-associated N-acetylmuramidase [Marivivens donghaensis]MDN3704011.1 holin-associated N-acetylmuramidase [Marivivens donghaensis]
MQTVQEIAKGIVAREGGYVNDPADPGGPTKYGVTLATLQRLRRDVTGDGRIDDRDVRALRDTDAVDIFVEHYFNQPRIGELPEPLQASVFDMYVNSGAGAVRILQRLLCDMRIPVAIDGVLGPQTIAAAHRGYDAAPDHIVDAYGIARRNYYYALADGRPSLRKFATRRDGGKGGWILRAEAFVSARYHLSDEAHKQRVSAWG